MPFCSSDGCQADLWHLPARWRDTTRCEEPTSYTAHGMDYAEVVFVYLKPGKP
jgi:hypothetical protein